MQFSKVSIVVPAYNEALAIGDVVKALIDGCHGAEIIVVNDGSNDETGKIAEQAGATVINHRQNRGYGASLATGIRKASRDYVLMCDADGQHRLEDVKRIVEAVDGFDMVVGARGKDSHQPLARRPGKLILKNFANYLAGIKIPDLNSGLRVFRKEVIVRYLHLMPDGFSFSTTSTFAILKSRERYKYRYIPIKVEQRVGNKSTVRQFKHGSQTIMLMLRLTVLFEPLKVFLAVAGALSLLSLLSFINDSLIAGEGLADTTVLLSIATVIIFMNGLLCDQVSALRREQKE